MRGYAVEYSTPAAEQTTACEIQQRISLAPSISKIRQLNATFKSNMALYFNSR